MSRASESDLAIISDQARRRHSARSRGAVAAQPGSAADAALTASSVSSAVASATSAMISSVAGSVTPISPPSRPLVH